MNPEISENQFFEKNIEKNDNDYFVEDVEIEHPTNIVKHVDSSRLKSNESLQQNIDFLNRNQDGMDETIDYIEDDHLKKFGDNFDNDEFLDQPLESNLEMNVDELLVDRDDSLEQFSNSHNNSNDIQMKKGFGIFRKHRSSKKQSNFQQKIHNNNSNSELAPSEGTTISNFELTQRKYFAFDGWNDGGVPGQKVQPKPIDSPDKDKEFSNSNLIAILTRYITNNQLNEFKTTIEKYKNHPGVDWNTKNEHGSTLLIWGIIEDRVEFIDFLQKNNIGDANEVDDDGNTPLSVAICNTRAHIVQRMLENDPNINIDKSDEEGNTPLHDACRMNATDIVKILIKAGANVDARNNDSETPVDLCTGNETRACFKGDKSPMSPNIFTSHFRIPLNSPGSGPLPLPEKSKEFGRNELLGKGLVFGRGMEFGQGTLRNFEFGRKNDNSNELRNNKQLFVFDSTPKKSYETSPSEYEQFDSSKYDFGAQPPNGTIEEILQWERSQREKLEMICRDLQTQVNTLRNENSSLKLQIEMDRKRHRENV